MNTHLMEALVNALTVDFGDFGEAGREDALEVANAADLVGIFQRRRRTKR